MFATSCNRSRINKGLGHTFDSLSGWCLHGCGNRDDGRITTREGSPIETGPNYSPTELAQIKSRTDQIIAARTPKRSTR